MSIILPQRDLCPFCENLADRRPCAWIYRDATIASFVNPRLYGKGAVLVIPIRHAPTLLDLTAEEPAAIFGHAQALVRALLAAYGPEGFNVFQNNGVAAGQSVAHYHLHIVPRYAGEEPGRIFGEGEFQRIPIEERLVIAEEIKQHLG